MGKDYSPLELAQIFCKELEKTGFTFHGECDPTKLEKPIAEMISDPEKGTFSDQRSRMNGGLIVQMMQLAKESLDNRLDVNQEDLEARICDFTRADLQAAVSQLRKNWEQYMHLAKEVDDEVASTPQPGGPPVNTIRMDQTGGT